MTKKTKPALILLLKGGNSSERSVSLESAKSVQKSLIKLGYDVVSFDMKKGIESLKKVIDKEKPLCVFNALHGGWGENGTIPAFLNMIKMPYTHSGVFASATAMNKQAAKAIASVLNIDVAKGFYSSAEWILKNETVDFDCVIKPNQEGSSVGVYILKQGDKIPKSIKEDVRLGKQFVVEEYIKGREFSAAVTDDEALGIIEIIPKSGFYDYEHKYQKGMSDHVFPQDITDDIKNKLLSDALKMHKFLGCKGFSRCDFRYDEEKKRVVFLEINTHPGMTDLSLVPEMAEKKGISYNQLVEYLIKRADFER